MGERTWFEIATTCSAEIAEAVLENALLIALCSSFVVDSAFNDTLESMYNQLMAGSVERLDVNRRLSKLVVY